MRGAEHAERADVLLDRRCWQRFTVEVHRDLLEATGRAEFEDGAFSRAILRCRNQRRERVEHECDQQKAADELAEAGRHEGAS